MLKKALFLLFLPLLAFAADPVPPDFIANTNLGPESPDIIDQRVLRDFIESRGLITCRQKEGTLTIAGDARARWVAANENVRGEGVRGFNKNEGINIYKSEVNLFFDYATPTAWLTTKLRWGVIDGIDAGSLTKVEIDRAFLGYDIYECGSEDFYIEIGRSKLDYMFESRVEFGAFFDGIHIYYTRPIPTVGTLTIHGGPMVVDAYNNHYGFIGEIGIGKWADTGFTAKYSLVNWVRHSDTIITGKVIGEKKIKDNPRYQFLVSQMLLGYERKINIARCQSLYIYGAALINSAAKRYATTNWKKFNQAWYAGFTLGKLCKAGDWSLDVNYQSVQVQAIPDFDLSGIGHGDLAGETLFEAIYLGYPAWRAGSFSNYKGPEMSFLYALTDSLSLRAHTAWTNPRNKEIGGDYRFKTFDMTVIFAF